jgi:hypothetical protein
VRGRGSFAGRQNRIVAAYGAKSPEDKVALVRAETSKQKTPFVGDGINDADDSEAELCRRPIPEKAARILNISWAESARSF